ncbi:MAG: hypothetical protein ABSC19_08390 [Syntrophorhabdales bacterium]|jgi:hypothetical protein
MTRLKVQSESKDKAVDMVKAAVVAEIRRMELGLEKTNRQISRFEKRYGISSDTFQRQFSAEDVKKGDDEYVRWAGELMIRDRIEADLKQLKGIRFVAA